MNGIQNEFRFFFCKNNLSIIFSFQLYIHIIYLYHVILTQGEKMATKKTKKS